MNRKILQKPYISGRYLNRIVSVSILLICSIFVYLLISVVIDYFGQLTSYLYEQNAHNIAHSYTRIIDNIDVNVEENIKILGVDNKLLTDSKEQIDDYFKDLRICIPKTFSTFEFADLNGNVFTYKKEDVNISGYKKFKEIIENPVKGEFYKDSMQYSLFTNEYCFIYYFPSFNQNNELNGIIIGEIPLKNFSRIATIMSVRGLDYTHICLVNEDGYIIYHPDITFMYKKFIYPEEFDENNTNFNSKMFFDDKNFESKNYVFIENIKDYKWKVVVILPNEKVNSLYFSINKFKMYVVVCLCFVFFALILGMYLISRFISNSFDNRTCVYAQEYFEVKANKLLKKKYRTRFIVIACDIRGMKFINQDKGFDVGNKIISSFAKNFKMFVSKVNGFCAHSYADHFYGIIQIDSVGEAIDFLTSEFKNIERTLSLENFHIFIKYGLTIVNPVSEDNVNVRNIKKFIGQAVFAKSLIKNNINRNYEFYSPKVEEKIRHEQLIEQEIEKAVMNDEFYVVYQPKINLNTEKITGAEALVRWKSSNPMLGIMAPGSFLPVFEKNGFIERLDFIVYEKVFKFIKSELQNGKQVVPVSINVSRYHLLEKNKFSQFFMEFLELFNKYEIPSKLVEIEILEQSSGGNSNFLNKVIDKFHEHGFNVAMDDFGSGESSLNMLSNLPIDVVKFDQKFLKSENSFEKTANIISTLVRLGKQLKKQTVFEGVETEEQKNFLKSIGCDTVQGYYYSKPLKQEEYEEFIKNNYR